jgi:hypothetical protein
MGLVEGKPQKNLVLLGINLLLLDYQSVLRKVIRRPFSLQLKDWPTRVNTSYNGKLSHNIWPFHLTRTQTHTFIRVHSFYQHSKITGII